MFHYLIDALHGKDSDCFILNAISVDTFNEYIVILPEALHVIEHSYNVLS